MKNPATSTGKFFKIGIKAYSDITTTATFDNPFGTNFVGEWNVERLFMYDSLAPTTTTS